jgi:hypothetical protein
MIEACDPDAKINDLRVLIKMNTGQDVKLTKKQICQVYDEIKDGKLPLPPLVLTSDKTYLIDKKSPLKPNDYEILFDASSKRTDIQRVARKVGLKQMVQMTKSQMIESIGKRLRYMKIHEPVKIGKRRVPPVKTMNRFNNTVVNANVNANRFNNTAVKTENRFNNTAVNANRFNNTAVNANRFNNTAVKTENRFNNTAVNANRFNNTAVNANRFNNTALKTENTAVKPRVFFPKGGLFVKGQKPKFLDGRVSAVKKPTRSIFAGLFGKKSNVPKVPNNTRVPNNTKVPNVPKVPNNTRVPNVPKVPTEIDLAVATNIIKKIGLKREKPFIDKLKVGGKRRNVIDEATEYKKLEDDFMVKIGKISLSNTDRNAIIRRMNTDDLNQLEAEAQLKSEVIKTNEQKMDIILATLPFINNASKLSFKSRSKAVGVNINSLIDEAKKNNETKRDAYVTSQKRKFANMIVNVKLSNEDKKSLENIIDNKTNLNSLKNRANKLVDQRMKEKTAIVKQNLLSFLTPLKINQTNKNGFITRFNRGESINTIKRAAKAREEEVARGEGENVRTRLNQNLNALNLNAQDKATIMRKFNNGNKNVSKLVEEAKKLKNQRNTGKLATEKERLTTLAKQLGVNIDVSKLTNLGGVANFEKRIRNAGAEKVKGTFTEKVQALSRIASNMNLTSNIQSNILKLKNDSEINAMKVRIIGAGKSKLSNRAKSLNVNFSKNIEKINDVTKLTPLRTKINNAGSAKKGAKKQKESEQLTMRRNETKQYINGTTLPQNKKNAFIRQVNLNATNLIELRKEVNAEIQKIKNTKRSKNLDELKQYLQPLNIDKSKFIKRFENTTISLENIKKVINDEVATKGNLESKKRTLADKISTAKGYGVAFNFNTNVNALNSVDKIDKLSGDVDTVVDDVINKGRNKLSDMIIDAKLKNDFMNKVTAIKTLKNLNSVQKQVTNRVANNAKTKKDEITKYMKQLGLNNQDVQMVVGRNLNINSSRKMANDMLDKKKRLELTQILNSKKVPVTNRKQFYNKITKNSNVRAIERDINAFMRKGSRNKEENVDKVLNTYNLKPEDRKAIREDWDYFTNMTIVDVKNKASNLSSQFKQEKESALRRHLQDDLKLSANDINAIMTNFNANPRNMNALHAKAKNLKEVSSEKTRLAERIRKAREENALNLKFKVDVKTMNDVRKLNAQINQAYIGKGKKNLSRRALNKNINISSELNAAKSMNDIQKLKNKLNGILKGKKNQDLRKIEEVTRNLNQENRNRFLQKFKNQNIELNTVLENIQKFKNSKTKEVHEKQKQELYTYLNETLNLNVKDRDTIMFEFNNTKNLNGMKRKANALKKTRASEKIVTDRKKLEELLKSMNLSQENKSNILKRFDNAPGNLESFEANAKSLIEQRKNETRSKERDSLMNYMNTLGLSSQNKNMIVGFFNQSPDKTLESAKNNASSTKKTRDQEKLENALKNLPNISETNKNKLRTNLGSGTAVNTVVNSAKRMNANAKVTKSAKQSTVNYILSKNLGDDGNKLIKNFNAGLLTANRVREEANKKRVSMNAQLVSDKKNKLRTFMKNTLLSNKEKNGFIDRVKLDTNLGNLEKDIKRIDTNLKTKRDTFAGKRAELQAVLDGLTDLNATQKRQFMNQVKNAGADIESIKRKAKSIDQAKKRGKVKRRKRAKPTEENNFNATKALNILNKQREGEVKRRERAVAKKNNGNNFNASAELNKQLNIEANRQKRNQDEKNFNATAELNKQLNIKGKEINKANTNKKVRNGVEFKLKQVKGLTNADIQEFMKKWDTSKNRTIFNQARKRGEGRIKGKKVKNERNKPKEENNFNAFAAMNQLNLAPTKNKLTKKAKDEVGRFGGRIGKWDPAIKNAKTNSELTNLEKQLNKKIELRKEIQASRIGPIKKRGHLEKVMQLKNNVGQRRKIFEQQLVNLAQNAKKKELSKYIVGLNIPAENKSRYVKQMNKPGANLNLIRRTVNKQVNQKITNASKSLVAGAIGKIQAKENKNIANASKALVAGAIGNLKRKNAAATKIQAGFRGKKGRNQARRALLNKAPVAETFVPEPKMTNNPLFRALVQKNKERRVVNAVKLAAKKTALSRASGSERVKMARNLAPAKQENVKKVANAIKIFNRQSAISAVNRLKKLSLAEKTRFKGQISGASTKERVKEIETSAIREDARKKAEENKKKEDERKKKADAEAERVRKLEAKKATRAAAERAAISAKKMLTETEKMKAKAAENKKFNDRLAEKRRLLREREAKSEPKKRKTKKR